MNKIIAFLLLTVITYSQQQIDINWPTLYDSDWPMVKRDPQLTGRSPYRGPQTPTVIWSKNLPNSIFSGPVIGQQGNLYFGTYFQDPNFAGLSDYFYGYDKDGNFLWQYKLGNSRPPQTGILIDSSHTIYFGSLDRYVYALNKDGTLKWKYDTGAPIFEVIMPNIDLQGNIYISNNAGFLFSFKPDGTLNWNVKYENGFSGRSPAIAPDGNTIYIPGRDSNLFAINLDGSLKWKYNCGILRRSPILDSNGKIYIIPETPRDANTMYVVSLNADGNINWLFEIPYVGAKYEHFSIPTIDKNGNIYFVAADTFNIGYRLLMSIDYNANYRWKYVFNDAENDDFWQPLICDNEGTVYVGSTHGHYYYAISSEGQLKWKLPLIYPMQQVDNTGAIASDGTLYIGVHRTSIGINSEKTLIAIKDTGTVSVEGKDLIINDYKLSQNYPNPFNPVTTIQYSVADAYYASATHVNLKVYDILGNEVTTLVNENKSAGSYNINFSGEGLTSGIYFYKLIAGDFVSVKKMMLIK